MREMHLQNACTLLERNMHVFLSMLSSKIAEATLASHRFSLKFGYQDDHYQI